METTKKAEVQSIKATQIHEVNGTPFNVIEVNNADKHEEVTTCRIVIGNQVISEREFASVEDARAFIAEKPWELIFSLSAYISNYVGKH